MSDSVFRITFYNQDEVYELYAKHIYQSDMYGFIEIEEFMFGERSQLLVDPGEEQLKRQFEGVSRSYVPMNAIIRIDEVEKEGIAKVKDAQGGGKVAHFPGIPPDSGKGAPTKE